MLFTHMLIVEIITNVVTIWTACEAEIVRLEFLN
jgi:hypothetical protein